MLGFPALRAAFQRFTAIHPAASQLLSLVSEDEIPPFEFEEIGPTRWVDVSPRIEKSSPFQPDRGRRLNSIHESSSLKMAREIQGWEERSGVVAIARRPSTGTREVVSPLPRSSTIDEVRVTMLDSMKRTMLRINNAEHTKERGVWYVDDYAREFDHDQLLLNGITSDAFFDLQNKQEFRMHPGRKADDALFQFLNGLTLADCGNVVQACVYQALLEVLGPEQFNALFGGLLTPLTITQFLYQEDPDATHHGNPLIDLFETPDGVTLGDKHDLKILRPGDICHIAGVKNYTAKHPAGAGQGWNLICVGENESGEMLFVGFGPKSFREPRTFEEIRKVLIAEYNKPQSKGDLAALAINRDSSNILINAQTQLGEALAFDQVGEDAEIGGLKAVVRPRFDLIHELVQGKKLNPNWMDQPTPETASVAPPSPEELNKDFTAIKRDEKFDRVLEKSFLNLKIRSDGSLDAAALVDADRIALKGILKLKRQSPGIPLENLANSLDNYEPRNAEQQRLKETAEKFIQHAIDPKRDYPMGFLLQGTPGLGKTHVASAIASDCAARGLTVKFINIDALGLAYNLEGKRIGGFPPPDFFDKIVAGADVVVLDDMNSKHGIEQDMIKAALEYVSRHKKAMIVTCNEEGSHVINDQLNSSSNLFNNPYGFLVPIEHLSGLSQRKSWWQEAGEPDEKRIAPYADRFKTILPVEAILPLAALMTYDGTKAGGIVLPGDRETATLIAGGLISMGVTGVRLVPPPYDIHGKWRHLDDLEESQILVMAVNSSTWNDSSWDQLSNVAMSIHNSGSKLIVVASNPDMSHFSAQQARRLGVLSAERKPRVQARMAALFQGYMVGCREEEITS